MLAARAFKLAGIPYDQFERHADVGGIWDIDNPGTSMYESAHFISSKYTSAFFGLSLPLPLFDRNQGAIARATAQIEVEDLSLGAEMGEARAEIERGAALLLKRREALAALERTVVQRIPVLRQMAEDAYREGSADILELLDANRSLRDFQLAHVQQLESVKLAEEIVIAASGIEPPPPVP